MRPSTIASLAMLRAILAEESVMLRHRMDRECRVCGVVYRTVEITSEDMDEMFDHGNVDRYETETCETGEVDVAVSLGCCPACEKDYYESLQEELPPEDQ